MKYWFEHMGKLYKIIPSDAYKCLTVASKRKFPWVLADANEKFLGQGITACDLHYYRTKHNAQVISEL